MKYFIILFLFLLIPPQLYAQRTNTPLQPSNQTEIFDFVLEVNDPNSPGNVNLPEDSGSLAPQDTQDVSENLDSVQVSDISNNNKWYGVMLGFIVVLLSVGIAYVYYKFRTNKKFFK